jgi:hypothetical protein
MLGAILCNLPHLYSSGSFHGFAPGNVKAGTSWNPNWATDYGPDVDKAKKASKREVERAVEELTLVPDMEPIERAQDIAKVSLVSELMQKESDLIAVMTAYYALKRWKKRNAIAAILLLM